MRYLILASILALGAVSGCAAFTPAEAQWTISTLNRDLPVVRDAVARVTTDARLLRDLEVIAANVSALDTLLNH
jgi:hypothetical protein